jgi:hypothetical protein
MSDKFIKSAALKRPVYSYFRWHFQESLMTGMGTLLPVNTVDWDAGKQPLTNVA